VRVPCPYPQWVKECVALGAPSVNTQTGQWTHHLGWQLLRVQAQRRQLELEQRQQQLLSVRPLGTLPPKLIAMCEQPSVEDLAARLLSTARKLSRSAQFKKYRLFLPEICQMLAEQIFNFEYVPKPYAYFIVTDPKPREVFAPHFYDRIVQRWFVLETEPHFDTRFLPNAYAHRKGRGPHKAIRDLRNKLRNRSLTYYLKADIKNFFYSIHRPTLWNLLQKHWFRYVENHPYYRWLVYIAKTIVFSDPTRNFYMTCPRSLIKLLPSHKSLFNGDVERGLPLGSATSQLLAAIYLHELDRFIVHELKLKHYFRYVDDFVILGSEETRLQTTLNSIDQFLKKRLEISLHPNKRIIQPVRYGIDFVGYVVWSRRTLVRQTTVKRMFYRFEQLSKLTSGQKVRLTDLHKSLRNLILRGARGSQLDNLIQKAFKSMQVAYKGWLVHADAHSLRIMLLTNHFSAPYG